MKKYKIYNKMINNKIFYIKIKIRILLMKKIIKNLLKKILNNKKQFKIRI